MQPIPDPSRHILIVEDDAEVAEVLARLLTEEGYGVEIASDATIALELARSTTPDLVLLNLMLPGLSGADFYGEFRARGLRSPVMVISGASEGQRRSQELGADAFVAKPFEIEDVLQAVQRLLQR